MVGAREAGGTGKAGERGTAEIAGMAPSGWPGGTPGTAVVARLRAALPDSLSSFLSRGTDLLQRNRYTRSTVLPTRIPGFDEVLGGGLPKGEVVEITGSRSSGRFSLVLSLLAAVTSQGNSAVFIDLGDSLDPRAVRAEGGDPSRLLWVRPRKFREALVAAEIVAATGFSLVVLDLGVDPIRRGPCREAAPWLRLARTVRTHDTAFVILGATRVSGPAARHVLSLARPRSFWKIEAPAPPLLEGLATGLLVEKHPGSGPGLYRRIRFQVPEALTRPERLEHEERGRAAGSVPAVAAEAPVLRNTESAEGGAPSKAAAAVHRRAVGA